MTENIFIRNRAFDETVTYHKLHVKTKPEKHAPKTEQPIFSTYHTCEECERINFMHWPIWRVLITIPNSTSSHSGFEMRYVCAPTWNSARSSYIAWIHSAYSKDELKNRRNEHKKITGSADYGAHCSPKRIK